MTRQTYFSAVLIAACMAVYMPAVSAQGSSDRTRTQKLRGASITLPKDWAWQSPVGEGLAAKLEMELKGRREEATGELFITPGGFVGTRIEELQAQAERNPEDLKNLKIAKGKKLAGQKRVIVVSYVKERGSDPVRVYERRHWLLRVYGNLYEWREEWPRRGAGRATGGLAALRRSIKVVVPPGHVPEDKARDYILQRVRFKLPQDWAWRRGEKGSKIRQTKSDGQLLFTASTEEIVRGQPWLLQVGIQAFESPGTVKGVHDANKNKLMEDWENVDRIEFGVKTMIAGEKGLMVSWVGNPNSAQTKELVFQRSYFFKHKGYHFIWFEIGPARAMKDASKDFKRARKGLRTY